MSVVNLGDTNWSTKSKAEAVVLKRGLLARNAVARSVAIGVEESAGIQSIISKIFIRATMNIVGSRK